MKCIAAGFVLLLASASSWSQDLDFTSHQVDRAARASTNIELDHLIEKLRDSSLLAQLYTSGSLPGNGNADSGIPDPVDQDPGTSTSTPQPVPATVASSESGGGAADPNSVLLLVMLLFVVQLARQHRSKHSVDRNARTKGGRSSFPD